MVVIWLVDIVLIGCMSADSRITNTSHELFMANRWNKCIIWMGNEHAIKGESMVSNRDGFHELFECETNWDGFPSDDWIRLKGEKAY